jgi:hypothetical protein
LFRGRKKINNNQSCKQRETQTSEDDNQPEMVDFKWNVDGRQKLSDYKGKLCSNFGLLGAGHET